jgi:hypothetical protein
MQRILHRRHPPQVEAFSRPANNNPALRLSAVKMRKIAIRCSCKILKDEGRKNLSDAVTGQ